jgi:hypothetical protein
VLAYACRLVEQLRRSIPLLNDMLFSLRYLVRLGSRYANRKPVRVEYNAMGDYMTNTLTIPKHTVWTVSLQGSDFATLQGPAFYCWYASTDLPVRPGCTGWPHCHPSSPEEKQ